MNRDRLTRLADFLDRLEHDRFDFGSYISDDWVYHPDDINLNNPTTCGTSACAIGYATMLPDMGLDGLNLHTNLIDKHTHIVDAVSAAFDITCAEVRYLFYPYGEDNGLKHSASPNEVASHIRNFMARNGVVISNV